MLSTLLVAMTLAAPCESLQTLALPDTTILSAALMPAGPFTPPPAPPAGGVAAGAAPGAAGGAAASATAKPVMVVAACRVVGRVRPAITFEVWMPASGWNGKFQAVGGGALPASSATARWPRP